MNIIMLTLEWTVPLSKYLFAYHIQPIISNSCVSDTSQTIDIDFV